MMWWNLMVLVGLGARTCLGAWQVTGRPGANHVLLHPQPVVSTTQQQSRRLTGGLRRAKYIQQTWTDEMQTWPNVAGEGHEQRPRQMVAGGNVGGCLRTRRSDGGQHR
ncbi:hypothetical protein IWX50DRAFT_432826 [Phyllosticta citricarpa]